MSNTESIGTVISDEETPSFQTVRIKLKAGQDVKPGTLVRISVTRGGKNIDMIARVRSAREHNPNEGPEDINVRDTMMIPSNYPLEEDSTIIYRLAEAQLIEEIIDENMQSPQTLPQSGANVFIANEDEIVDTLGLVKDESIGLRIGETVAGTTAEIILKREAIQRHLFLCGTTGSGKSYAIGVIAEELVIKHKLPTIFIDTQNEYSSLVKSLGGEVLIPGENFNIRISSLTERELISIVPDPTERQGDIISAAFMELQDELQAGTITRFSIEDLENRIGEVGPSLTNTQSTIQLARTKAGFLSRNNIFGEGIGRANWPKFMFPCLSINCKHLTSSRVQTVATALLRELQDLRLRGFIPPYVVVIDEAHLFVPEGEGSACKQIIREGVRIGRHHGIALVLMTQSPVDIDKRAIRQCNTRLVFALEQDQLEALRGVRSDASDEMLQNLPKMPQGTCLLSGTYESVKHAIPVKIRTRKTENSEGGETPDIFEEMGKEGKNWIEKITKLKKEDSKKKGDVNGT